MLKIRAFEPDDLARLHEIRAAAFTPVFASFRKLVGDDIAPVAMFNAETEQGEHLNAIAKSDANVEIYVAEDGGKIVGFMSLTLDGGTGLGEIGLNAVDPAHQGQGIGTQLFNYALTRMSEAGMSAATVGTGGDDSHAPARRAYEKVGFDRRIPSVCYYRKL